MVLDKSQKEPDYQEGDDKRGDHSGGEDHQLGAGEAPVVLEKLQQRGACHDGDRQNEGEVSRRCTGYADNKASDDGGAGA